MYNFMHGYDSVAFFFFIALFHFVVVIMHSFHELVPDFAHFLQLSCIKSVIGFALSVCENKAYTGWPRKNATTLIVNFKNIVDETATTLIVNFFFFFW